MSNDKNNTIHVTNLQPLLSTVRTQDGSTLPFSDDIDVTGENLDGTEDNIDIAGGYIDETTYIDDTADSDVTSYILPRVKTRTPAATPVRASVSRTASTSTSFTARFGSLQSHVLPPNMTRNVRSPDRSPERSRGIISGGPARLSDGVAIAVDVQFNESVAASPQQSDNDGEEEEEEEEDYDDDWTPSYMLSYDPVPGVFNLDHAIEEAREKGDGGDSDVEGDEVLIHDEVIQEAEQDLQEAQDDNETLEYKDANSIIMARKNQQMTVDPVIKLPSPPYTWLPPLPKVDKVEPMYDEVDNHGDWKEYTYCAKFEKGRYKYHCIPTGAKPVPVNSDGERHMSGWEFHYKG
jgi:hypothetical protein